MDSNLFRRAELRRRKRPTTCKAKGRSFLLRLLGFLAAGSVISWVALFVHVNFRTSIRSHPLRLFPFFKRFTTLDSAALLLDCYALHPVEADILKRSIDPVDNSNLTRNCTAYKNARWFDFPACEAKVLWMVELGDSDKCYAAHGVKKESYCTILDYLSKMEGVCPQPDPNIANVSTEAHVMNSKSVKNQAITKIASSNLSSLTYLALDFEAVTRTLKQPSSGRPTLKWITQRIRSNWKYWQSAAIQFCLESNGSFLNSTEPTNGTYGNHLKRIGCNLKRLRIHVHIGSLTEVSGTRIAELAGHGGPLGELVQWSDLLAALIVLGHDVTITTELHDLKIFMWRLQQWNSPCQIKNYGLDLIYMDIGGVLQLGRHVLKEWLDKWKCIFRLIDTFGTEPKFNDYTYSTSHNFATMWGRWGLNTLQFFTMFPHTPDNSFLGFVITSNETSMESILATERRREKASQSKEITLFNVTTTIGGNSSFESADISSQEREQSVARNRTRSLPPRSSVAALVYGKTLDIWRGKERYLRVFNEYVVLHATVSGPDDKKIIPSYVINHGLVDQVKLEKLYRSARIFVGLGFPYEGPSPLEAIAHGCVFINVRFNTPLNRDNSEFFSGKPTSRVLTSQHPYLETFIGEPYVYTVDANDFYQLRLVIQRILKAKRPKPYVPYEFTPIGFLERLHFFQSSQSFCPLRNDYSLTSLRYAYNQVTWPPADCVQAYLGAPGISCNEVCSLHKRICAPTHFLLLNYVEVLENYGIKCAKVEKVADIGLPAVQLASPADLRRLDTFTKKNAHRLASKASGENVSALATADCYLQSNDRLYSCAEPVDNMRRICPCRRYRLLRQQTALC